MKSQAFFCSYELLFMRPTSTPTCLISSEFRQLKTPYQLVAKYYGGLKFIPLGFKRLVILLSVDKVKLNLSSCFSLANLTLVKHDDNFNFTL